MDFTFTPEQDALREQAREFLAATPEPTWAQLAELGWTGVSIAEEDGGAGLSFVEEAVLFEELGQALYHGPYFATIALDAPGIARRAARRGRRGGVELDARARPARSRSRHRRARRDRRRRRHLRARGRRARGARDDGRHAPARRRPRRRRGPASRRLVGPPGDRGARVHGPRARGVRRGAARPRGRPRARLLAGAVREEDRRLPGRLASARERVHPPRALPLARALGRLVRRGRGPAGRARGSGGEVVRRRERRRRVRDGDPVARRHRLHLGAPAPAPVQARARDRELRRFGGAPARRGRRRPAGRGSEPGPSRRPCPSLEEAEEVPWTA